MCWTNKKKRGEAGELYIYIIVQTNVFGTHTQTSKCRKNVILSTLNTHMLCHARHQQTEIELHFFFSKLQPIKVVMTTSSHLFLPTVWRFVMDTYRWKTWNKFRLVLILKPPPDSPHRCPINWIHLGCGGPGAADHWQQLHAAVASIWANISVGVFQHFNQCHGPVKAVQNANQQPTMHKQSPSNKVIDEVLAEPIEN